MSDAEADPIHHDNALTLMIGGKITIKNGRYSIEAGEEVMWYFEEEAEAGMFDDNGLRVKRISNVGDNGDVEYVNPAFAFQHVAEFVLCKAEQQTLACIPPHQQQAKFFEYWTAKEALLKLLGTGLRRDPTTLHMAHNEAGGIRSARFPTIRLVPLQIIDGDFVGLVAYGHQNPSIVYQAIPTLHVL